MSDTAPLNYHVMLPGRRISLTAPKSQVQDSVHATLEEALGRCREIVFRELEGRHLEEPSLSRCVSDYVENEGPPWVQPSDGGRKVFSEALAKEWMAEQAEKDWPSLMERIATAEAEIPRSWFRWLHHSYLSRMNASVHLELTAEWSAIAHAVALDKTRLDAALMPHLEKHAWEIGRHGLHQLGDACWAQLSREARGRLLAGISSLSDLLDNEFIDFSVLAKADARLKKQEEDAEAWLLAHLPEADLSAESVLEIACHAVRRQRETLLAEVLKHGAGRLHESIARMGPFRRKGWSKDECDFEGIKRLSNRVNDMVLEASVLRRYLPGARLALEAGANPNLPIWALERSSNEDFTALSYSIGNDAPELTDLLLGAGANPANDGSSKCLFLAMKSADDMLAERLLAAGATLDEGDKPEWLAKSAPGDDIERQASFRFNCYQADIEKAQRLGVGLPLVHASQTAWFYQGDGQGGSYSTFLSHFFYRDDLRRLQHFHAKGLPLRVTLSDLAIALGWGAYDCLCWMMQTWSTPLAPMLKIRREMPDFGTQRRLWMVQADARRVGLLDAFDTEGLEPLVLPDGGRLWMDLSGIAIQDIETGPVWSRKTTVDARRRPRAVVLRGVSAVWEIKPVPKNDRMLRDLIPVVKEIGGVFLHTGLTLEDMCRQDYPQGWKERITEWLEGDAWKRQRPTVLARAAVNEPEGYFPAHTPATSAGVT